VGKKKFDHDEFVRLWHEHHDVQVVADIVGTSRSYASQILRKKGIVLKKGHPYHYDLPMEEVIQRYKDGESCARVGATYGVGAEVIRKRLRTLGIKRRSLKESVPRGPDNVFYKNGKGGTKVMHYYRRQCYEVAAICLGQPVPKGWVIHHIDENPRNNNPGNLMLFVSARAHSKYHQLLLKLQRGAKRVNEIQLALKSGALMLPLPPHQIELPPDINLPDPSEKPDGPEWFQLELGSENNPDF
jgi:hypothetical protein